MDDAMIVDLYWDRNEQAIKESESKFGSYCHAIAYRILADQDDADESVNDTWLAAWESIPPHRPSVLSAYLGKLTRRISLNRWRDRNRDKRGGGEVDLSLEELAECVPDSENVEQVSGRLYYAIWNEDISGAILNLCLENEVVTDYYLNMETWETTEIGALTGVTGATAVFADNNTLLLYQWGGSVWMPDSVTVWSYDLSTGVLTKTLNEVSIYNEFDEYPHGVILLGNQCPYCIVVSMNGKTQVVNQVTGTVTTVENFTFSPYSGVLSNPNGTKLLYFVYDMDDNSLLQWSQLGVIDVEKGTFIAFDRDAADIRDESIFWLDDNRVAVRNYSLENDTVRGLYLYEF